MELPNGPDASRIGNYITGFGSYLEMWVSYSLHSPTSIYHATNYGNKNILYNEQAQQNKQLLKTRNINELRNNNKVRQIKYLEASYERMRFNIVNFIRSHYLTYNTVMAFCLFFSFDINTVFTIWFYKVL